jgi:Arc/MetJ-type ribon-helix-helix transcriptional regulator
VPDSVAAKLKELVDGGWFASEDETTRLALADFLRRHRFELEERFQRDDVRWALEQKATAD